MATALAESLFGAAVHEDIEYTLTITDVEKSLLRVASFQSAEFLSLPFRYDVIVGTEPDAVAGLEDALGRDASFTITRDGEVVRVVHGIIVDVVPDGTFIGKTQAKVTFVLAPRLANLQYSGGFRIFQNMAVHEIIGEICKPEQIECLWHVHGVPPKREYCTQQDESDLDFVMRIASEEGLHFFFAHDEKKTTVVFANAADGYEEIEPKLTISFNDTQGAVGAEHVRSIERTQSIRTGSFEHRDYHFAKPDMVLLSREETAGKETTCNSHKREWRDYPGWYVDKDGVGKSRAKMKLNELRSDAFVFTGSASSLRLSPGRSFTLGGHREDGFNRKLLLTSVQMEGAVQGALRDGGGFRAATRLATFTAVPAENTIHPRRLPKPASRLHSARVVGPKDGDPYVDEYGRVKVQFFWDRDGKFNENSSCWMRMMTPVAHADEGFWQAHKVGSEVLVDFIDGDIDRPVIMGAVYNPAQWQPHPLPAQVAKSTWKTKSIPGNEGFNEITQDNTAGKEEIFLHAQRDQREVVLHNHMENIGANQTTSVGANQTINVGANRSVSVGANHTVTVTGNETNHVKKKRTEFVDQAEAVTVKLGRTHTVKEGDDKLDVTDGNRNVTVKLEDTLKAKKKTDFIETEFDLNADTSVTIHHKTDSTLVLQQNEALLKTDTKIVLTNSKSTITIQDGVVTIAAADEIKLDAGGSAMLSLKKDGSLSLTGPKEVSVACKSSTVTLEPAKATINGSAVNVTASGMMEISGAMIKIN